MPFFRSLHRALPLRLWCFEMGESGAESPNIKSYRSGMRQWVKPGLLGRTISAFVFLRFTCELRRLVPGLRASVPKVHTNGRSRVATGLGLAGCGKTPV
jgi:hypothetical protein